MIPRGDTMSTITIRTSEKEKKLIKEYAKFNGMTISDFIKKLMIEKIEDEYDYQVGERAYKENLASGEKPIPIADLLEKIENE